MAARRRQPTAADTKGTFAFPNDKVGLLIGKQGVTQKAIEAEFDVSIYFPPRSDVVGSIEITLEGTYVEAAYNKIMTFAGAGPPNGTMGGGMGGGGMAGIEGDKTICIYLLRINKSHQLEILVQHKTFAKHEPKWAVPGGVLNYPTDVQTEANGAEHYSNGILRILNEACNGPQSPIPWSALILLGGAPTVYKNVVTANILLPPLDENWFQWVPRPSDNYAKHLCRTGAPLVFPHLMSAPFLPMEGQVWVPVGECYVDCNAPMTQLHTSVQNWFKYNVKGVETQIKQELAKLGHAITVSVIPSWTSTKQVMLQEFHQFLTVCMGLSAEQFVHAAALFDERAVEEVLTKYKSAMGANP